MVFNAISLWPELTSIANVNDGAMHTYLLDLAGYPGWSGTITWLRIDPVLAGSGGVVTFDSVQVLGASRVSMRKNRPRYQTSRQQHVTFLEV